MERMKNKKPTVRPKENKDFIQTFFKNFSLKENKKRAIKNYR